MNSQFAKTAMIFYKLAIHVCVCNCRQTEFLCMNTCSLYFILCFFLKLLQIFLHGLKKNPHNFLACTCKTAFENTCTL